MSDQVEAEATRPTLFLTPEGVERVKTRAKWHTANVEARMDELIASGRIQVRGDRR